ncbi:sulfatase-like hydrolase/transferase [Amylibacter sp. IMCC11727]|uniref:sulfatase family protein n=1 Tax=Amylibacter sp. IMCC11727 TaxID=3039851 RepID=UPI00244DE01A|nr:sulfatase-like hydrolase/transferase [Amylibacter sp. IMCC11727]WGI21530.1 sulfatase-like hydrolase/transferase [Amylibacter sp. IMCC11727]
MKQPNILFFMTDNQPAEALGCAGNTELKTPNIDALAKRGTRFTNAHCVNAMCSPCRASVLTGLMPSQHGVHNWLDDTLMDQWPQNWSAIEEFPTLPQQFKAAGYNTALIGKYHLGMPFEPQNGFDHWVTFPHGHTHTFYGNEVIDNGKRYTVDGHTVDFFAQKTHEYLETQTDSDAPFFAFVPFNGPYGHFPAISGRGPEPFATMYDDADMHSIPREGLNPAIIDRLAMRLAAGGGKIRPQFKGPLLLPNNMEALRNYYAQISLIDHHIGEILATLDRLDLTRDTIIVFTADHGFSLGHNGIWGHGAATWPSTTHHAAFNIPLIIAGDPIAAKGQISDGLTSQLDVYQTLASLAGITPETTLPSAANDLTPTLTGKPQTFPDAVFMEQEETRAIRTNDWLYMQRFNGAVDFPTTDALYNLTSDPAETTDLAADPAHTDITKSLRAKITAFFDTHSQPQYDLWSGGSAKSNTQAPELWQNAWGADWAPERPARP